MRDGAMADDGESVGVFGDYTISHENPIVRRIEHNFYLVRANPVVSKAKAMRFVHRQHQIRTPCAEALLKLHDRNAERAEPTGKLVAIQLGHRVVHVEHQLGSRAAQRKCGQDRRVGHGANDRKIIWLGARELLGLAAGGDKEIYIAFEIGGSAGATVARYFQPDNVYTVDQAGLARRQRDRVNLIAAPSQRLGVPFHAAIMNIRGVGDN